MSELDRCMMRKYLKTYHIGDYVDVRFNSDRKRTYLRTYHIDDHVDIRVNNVVHMTMLAKPLFVLASLDMMCPLVYVRCVRHASVCLSCCEMEIFPRRRVGCLSFIHQCPCLEGEAEGT
ncbi:hypothetical protein MTR_3g013910 [Medicago truncatula]|uniref:Uncharacterized protein n=1 Tax=Medicago truncatula TaxID=3880 RepID=G7IYP3_MEDTR|nr:hypothetical protein MTR_3g013910 [Medicago truncatula]